MCKRFIDTGLWKQSWFLDLTPELKLIWQYLTVNCDTAGIWKIDIRQLKRDTGIGNINFDEVIAALNKDYDPRSDAELNVKRIVYISNNEKIWITGYISFQNEKGKNGVNAAIPAVKGAINRLRDEGILDYAIENNFVRVINYHAANEINSIKYSNNDNKGLQPFATDKDKGKGRSASCCGSDLKEDGGAGEETFFPAETGEGCNSENDSDTVGVVRVEDLYLKCWGFLPKNSGEINSAYGLLNEYGEEELSFALRQSLEHKKTTIAYIRGICRNRREKAAAEKAKAEALNKAQELNRIVQEQREQGVKLNLIEQVYGKQESQSDT